MNFASLRELALRTGSDIHALRRVETGVTRNAVSMKTIDAIIYLGLSPVEFQRAHEEWLDAQRAEVSP